MRHLSIRNVPSDLSRRLLEEKLARGASLNQTVLDLLSQAVGLGSRPRSNGLGALAGTWSADDHTEFEHAIAETEDIDDDLWR